ncbi:MAG: tetraacyldisaccharide 4'-kinase [Bdellovibrio sp.]
MKPLSFLYDQIVGVKNSLYDRGLIAAYKAPVPVVSIGNLTVGGTGKTPITDYCLKALVAQGKKVAVISRSYKAEVMDPALVDVKRPYAARYYGDEPVLLAQANPAVCVFVGPSKWQTARYAVAEQNFDILIVDDGFQHRKLHRDLNIVILDATEVLEHYAVLPEGRARESWDNLARADIIILSKTNLAKEEDLKALESKLPVGKEVLYFSYTITRCQNAVTGESRTREDLQGKKLHLISAIARPDVFERMMRDLGEVTKNSRHFRDHHQYTAQEAQELEEEFVRSQADYMVTTEKDAVKLRPLLSDPSRLWTASLEVVERGEKGHLHEIISQVLR